MEEENTAPELTEFLDKPLPSKKRTVEQAFEDDVEEKDPNESKPITQQTKKSILRIAATLINSDPKHYLPIVEKLRKMTESEALLYLECLEAQHNTETYGALTMRVVETLADIIVHPEDNETKSEMLDDQVLHNLTSQKVGKLLETAGNAGLFFLLSFYGITSWSRRYIQIFQKRKTESPTTNPTSTSTTPPVPNDRSSTQSIGEDDFDGEADDSEVGETV